MSAVIGRITIEPGKPGGKPWMSQGRILLVTLASWWLGVASGSAADGRSCPELQGFNPQEPGHNPCMSALSER
jgi:hypothetical protein